MKRWILGFLLFAGFPVVASSAVDLVEYWNFRNARWDYEGQFDDKESHGSLTGTAQPSGEKTRVLLSYVGSRNKWQVLLDYDLERIRLLGISILGDEFLLEKPFPIPRWVAPGLDWTWQTEANLGNRSIPLDFTVRILQGDPIQTRVGNHEEILTFILGMKAGALTQIENSFYLARAIGPVQIEEKYSGLTENHLSKILLTAYFPEPPVESLGTPTETPTAIPETPTATPTVPTPMAESPTLTPTGNLIVGNIATQPGESAFVRIAAVGMPETDSFQFDLLYDPGILNPAAVNPNAGTLTENWYAVTGAILHPGRLRIVAIAGTAPSISGDGLLMGIWFAVQSDATPGTGALVIDKVTGSLANLSPVNGVVTIFPAIGTPTESPTATPTRVSTSTPTQPRPTPTSTPTYTPRPKPTRTPIRKQTPIPVTPVIAISTFTPTPTHPSVSPDVPRFRFNVLERIQRSGGEPVRFTCEMIPKNQVRSRVYLKVRKLDSRMMARFDPPSLIMPGVSVLKLSLAPGVKKAAQPVEIHRFRRDIEILAVAAPLGSANARVTSATRKVTVIFTPGEEPDPKLRTILSRKIHIYLTTDASLTEQVGDFVRIGGRLGMNPGVRSVQLFAQRGKGIPFNANVPLKPGDDRFLVRIPVLSPLMLAGVWRVGAQLQSNDPDMPVIGRSGALTIPVGALRAEGKWMRGKRLLAQEDILSALFGNLILVAGASGSHVPEETIQRLVRERYVEMTTERRFTSARLTVYSENEIPGEPEAPVSSPASTQALAARIGEIPPEDPLTIYCVGAAGDVGEFRISSTETLDVNALGSVLTVSHRTGPTLLIIDCDHAAAVASAIRSAAGGNPNLLLIASTGSGESNIALFGTLPDSGQPFSFSDFFFDLLLSGESLLDSFNDASERLIQMQGPVRLQEPALLPDPIPQPFEEFLIGVPYVADLETSGVPDRVEPVIVTGVETSDVVRGEALAITATVEDESTPPEDLGVLAHVAPSDDPGNFAEFAMTYDTENERRQVVLADFPESVFGPEVTTDHFTVSILAEDDSGNSADPLVTSVVVSEAPAQWSLRVTDINGDGVADTDDLMGMRNFWHQETEDDISGDGMWGPLDLILFQMAWQMRWE